MKNIASLNFNILDPDVCRLKNWTCKYLIYVSSNNLWLDKYNGRDECWILEFVIGNSEALIYFKKGPEDLLIQEFICLSGEFVSRRKLWDRFSRSLVYLS